MTASTLYEYAGDIFPTYLKDGNACQFIAPAALHFCKGRGVDVGAGRWPLDGAIPVELINGGNAYSLPEDDLDYVFSSHCLEHLDDPVGALLHWRERIRPGGVIFLYLPHPDMTYWRPTRNRKHLHSWYPEDMAAIMRDLDMVDVVNSERDMYWSFSVVGYKP